MIESIEGKRGLPRHKPPFVSKVGLFGRPTLNHNIETVFWVPRILSKGHEWFSKQGKDGHKGPHSYSVSGRVKKPGVKLAPAGISMNELCEITPGRVGEDQQYWLNSDKIIKDVNWSQKINLNEGIGMLVNWGKKYKNSLLNEETLFTLRA